MKIKFWGVRGSIPCPGSKTVRYGGNTPCVELRFKDTDRLIIIDAGSGIRELGNFIMGHDLPKGPIKTELFLTHTHWDHIMGFPFFVPAYIPGTDLMIYGPETHEADTLEEIVGGQLAYRYFPVRDVELSASIWYENLKEEQRDLGDGIILNTKYLNHPILCLGYRFEYKGKVFCTAYDTEPFTNLFSTDPDDPSYDEAMAQEGAMVAKEQNNMVESFFAGADLVIYDTQYTQAEYLDGKVGWGHTSIEHAVAAANRAGVKKMVTFHYDPMRTDDQLDALAADFCEPGKYGSTEVIFAREGLELDV
ncbi:MAG: MBL fold metallo-hydrolase [Proteobacteria bacterium]|nr:MBL fold metallo-hydrolase [Pseudomonadota bacterium]MBU1716039.1 MBL fold metallo-hydrolase [Pseudomonadota bacterium]